MYCRVLQLWENGHLLPKHRHNSASKWSEGEFTFEPCEHEAFNRTMRRAKLIQTIEAGGMGNEVLPYLYDASLVTMQADWMRVSGFYFDDSTKNALMQTWHVIILASDYREWVIKDSIEKQLREEKAQQQKKNQNVRND